MKAKVLDFTVLSIFFRCHLLEGLAHVLGCWDCHNADKEQVSKGYCAWRAHSERHSPCSFLIVPFAVKTIS